MESAQSFLSLPPILDQPGLTWGAVTLPNFQSVLGQAGSDTESLVVPVAPGCLLGAHHGPSSHCTLCSEITVFLGTWHPDPNQCTVHVRTKLRAGLHPTTRGILHAILRQFGGHSDIGFAINVGITRGDMLGISDFPIHPFYKYRSPPQGHYTCLGTVGDVMSGSGRSTPAVYAVESDERAAFVKFYKQESNPVVISLYLTPNYGAHIFDPYPHSVRMTDEETKEYERRAGHSYLQHRYPHVLGGIQVHSSRATSTALVAHLRLESIKIIVLDLGVTISRVDDGSDFILPGGMPLSIHTITAWFGITPSTLLTYRSNFNKVKRTLDVLKSHTGSLTAEQSRDLLHFDELLHPSQGMDPRSVAVRGFVRRWRQREVMDLCATYLSSITAVFAT